VQPAPEGESTSPNSSGSSKWNKIEHRLFSFISRNWRGKPLISLEVIINLIAATTIRTGLQVYAQLDTRPHPDKIRVSDAELAAVNTHKNDLHPDSNYHIIPRVTNPKFPLVMRRFFAVSRGLGAAWGFWVVST
jgi:hypothetical protein